uniref:Uncharacterized protein n=1 Tax=Rhizophora mucronata TaxID=61149 RepID=A0A2P2NBK9_RHIMU
MYGGFLFWIFLSWPNDMDLYLELHGICGSALQFFMAVDTSSLLYVRKLRLPNDIIYSWGFVEGQMFVSSNRN